MSNTTAEANAEHERCLADCEAFVKAGNKINVIPSRQKSDILPGTINKKTAKKPIDTPAELKGLSNIQKTEFVIKKFKVLTSLDLQLKAGICKGEVFRCARLLENDGVITRTTSKGLGGTTTFNYVEGE
jgi:hypothetical protein